jgi:PKD repeat protein
MLRSYCYQIKHYDGSLIQPLNGGLSQQAINGPPYTPIELAQLYGFPTDVDGTGQTVGIIELGGGYTLPDFHQYLTSIGVTKVPNVVDVSVNGGKNNPAQYNESFEVCLDLDIIAAIAPGCNIRMYFAPNSFVDFVAAVQACINDNCNIISISWGLAELYWAPAARNAMNQVCQQAASLGISIFCAAGDNGASEGHTGLNVVFPSSCPYTISCGGTTITSANGVITSETVWGDASNSATGGGISAIFSKPSYQNSVPLLNSYNFRGTPDIAANANPNSGYIVRVENNYYVIGGTSAVSPLLSAFTALVNQKRLEASKPVIGFIHNPLYSAPLSVFRDITQGNNFGYDAATGWDFTTGLGSPSSSLYTYLLQHVTLPLSSFSFSALSGTAPLTVAFTDTSAGNPTAWRWDFGNGGISTLKNPASVTYYTPGTYTVSLSVSNSGGSNSSSESITVSSVPGVPVSVFSVSPISGNSPLTVSFTNNSTNNPTSWLWSFGNGNTSTLQNPSPIVYTVAKTYTISLKVTNSFGTRTSYKSITVTPTPAPEPVPPTPAPEPVPPTPAPEPVPPTPAPAPVANFTYSNRTVTFNDTSTNSPTAWLWTFGDGTNSTLRNPTKTYSNAGNYTVDLRATNSQGFMTISQTITIF